jgi:hypothetical protein
MAENGNWPNLAPPQIAEPKNGEVCGHTPGESVNPKGLREKQFVSLYRINSFGRLGGGLDSWLGFGLGRRRRSGRRSASHARPNIANARKAGFAGNYPASARRWDRSGKTLTVFPSDALQRQAGRVAGLWVQNAGE